MSARAADLLGRTTLKQIERYVLWSIYVIDVFFAAAALAMALAEGSAAERLRPAAAVLCAALVASTAIHLALTRPALEHYCGGPRVAPRLLGAGLLAALVCVGAAIAVQLLREGEDLPVVGPWSVLLALTPALCVWALLPRGRRGVALVCLVAALAPAAVWVAQDGPLGPAQALLVVAMYLLNVLMTTGVVVSVRLSGWLLAVTRELDRARQAAGRLAVAEERLRFSRDLHDIVGRSLSGISLTSELAGALLARGRTEQAAQEIGKVRGLVARAQADMRAVVAEYRRADLSDELAAAGQLVERAGARRTSTLTDAQIAALPDQVREAFAWVVREGTTNALRHSRPTRVDLVHEVAGGAARLTLTNDGAQAPNGDAPATDGGGHGLTGLRERLAPLGGRLEARREGDVHVLVCTLPVSAGPESSTEPELSPGPGATIPPAPPSQGAAHERHPRAARR